MTLSISNDIFARFPSLHLGVLVLEGVDNGSGRDYSSELGEAQAKARDAIGAIPVTEHPHIHCWREAYRAFGAKPKKYPSSIENLARRALKGELLRSIHPLVDVYNIVSLEHLVPVGGEDLDAVRGGVRLAVAGDSEPDVVLLGEKEARPPKPGEIIYTDDRGAICRRWNWKEADRTKLTERTERAVLVVETLAPVGRDKLEAALDDLEARVSAAVGGTSQRYVLDERHRAGELG